MENPFRRIQVRKTQVALRVSEEELQVLDEIAGRLALEWKDDSVGRSDALRYLLEKGLEAEREQNA